MSLRQLVEGDCGGQNPLMQFGNQIARDSTFKEEGFSGTGSSAGATFSPAPREALTGNDFAAEYLEQIIAPPMTFQMDALLQEMREIEASDFHPQLVSAPRVIDEVTKASDWASEFVKPQQGKLNEFWDQSRNMIHVQPVQKEVIWVSEFFDVNQEDNSNAHPSEVNMERAFAEEKFRQFPPLAPHELGAVGAIGGLSSEMETEELPKTLTSENWLEEFQKSKAEEVEKTDNFNQKFWQRLEDEWKRLCDEEKGEHPWLADFNDYYDQYKVYNFTADNPMLEDENALEKGKVFLAQGDIPSAVLCFEAAVTKNPELAEAWELLGISQAENEMDPLAIAALIKAHELQPDNMKVLMALAVSYTNESLQSQALKVLTQWLHCNPKYKHLVPQNLLQYDETKLTSSLIRGPELRETQNLFLEAVKQNRTEIDPDIQEALGVLFNLSSEYDKAADCFRAALQVRPDNAKIWNRLGASLANGNRSIEAVDAYRRALEIEPGFIRARYNVGIDCMNLKAYKEAAEHLLIALNLQASASSRSGLAESKRIMSDTIWSTLRMVLSLMGRRDLQEYMDTRNLDALNKALGDS